MLDLKKIQDVEVTNIVFSDYPDFVDAYIKSASYDGVELTESQLEWLNNQYDFLYQAILNQIY